jgi:hypothetical protein
MLRVDNNVCLPSTVFRGAALAFFPCVHRATDQFVARMQGTEIRGFVATISQQPRIPPKLHPGYTLHAFVIPNEGEESGDFSLRSK